MLKQVRSWLAVAFLLVSVVALIALALYVSWTQAPFLAGILTGWLALVVIGFVLSYRRRPRYVDVPDDRRRTIEMADELERLKPGSHVARLARSESGRERHRDDLQ